jgi:hypothetical protein
MASTDAQTVIGELELTRNQFIVILLTPLVVMTAVGVPLMLVFEWGWLVVPLAANAAGANRRPVDDCDASGVSSRCSPRRPRRWCPHSG